MKGAARSAIIAVANHVAHDIARGRGYRKTPKWLREKLAETEPEKKSTDDQKKVATDRKFKETTTEFKKMQLAYLFEEGVGIFGTYEVSGSITTYYDSEGNIHVVVFAQAKVMNPSVTPVFRGNVEVETNLGVTSKFNFVKPNGAFIYESGQSVLGSRTFVGPTTNTNYIKVKITAGYQTFYDRNIPLPASTNFEVSLPLSN